jgi:hypothetical protein
MTMVSFVKGRIMKTKIDWAPFPPVVGERHRIVPCTEMTPSRSIFADGVVEDITMARWRFHWLFVIARNSSFTYKGRTVDVKQVGRELRVRYVPEGSVRKAGNRLRIQGSSSMPERERISGQIVLTVRSKMHSICGPSRCQCGWGNSAEAATRGD